MSPEYGHPGADLKEGVDFKAYLPYINREGLSPNVARTLEKKLKRFYDESQKNEFPLLWKPGSCRRTKDYFYRAKKKFKPFPLNLWYNTQEHYWYQVAMDDNIVVVDPSGLPKDEETVEQMKEFIKGKPRLPDFAPGIIVYSAEEMQRQLENNPAYQFRHSYQPYFGLAENAPEVHKKVYTSSTNSFQVSRGSIWRYHERNYPLW